MNYKEFYGMYQKAVLWEASPAIADPYGDKKVLAPVEIDVRWRSSRNTQSVGGDSPQSTEQVVATITVDRSLPIGSILWLGEKKNLPAPRGELVTVTRNGVVPDVKGGDPELTVVCSRFNNTLPAAG